jgi:predicted house-cleaning noncanonical NTP pyrophosphatase (MazG superfamily)
LIVYNKLVRDRIPEIIRAQGKECETRVLRDAEYLAQLNRKLREELDEYEGSGSVAELADLAEVIYALAAYYGKTPQQFDSLRLAKQRERGAFEDRLLLVRADA